MQLFKIHGRLQMIHARFSKYMINNNKFCYKSGNREQFFAKRKMKEGELSAARFPYALAQNKYNY